MPTSYTVEEKVRPKGDTFYGHRNEFCLNMHSVSMVECRFLLGKLI